MKHTGTGTGTGAAEGQRETKGIFHCTPALPGRPRGVSSQAALGGPRLAVSRVLRAAGWRRPLRTDPRSALAPAWEHLGGWLDPASTPRHTCISCHRREQRGGNEETQASGESDSWEEVYTLR